MDVWKLTMKCDYYKFYVFDPYIFGGEKHRTLREAKEAVYAHIRKGHKGDWSILGCTLKDDCNFLTYTPFWSYEQTFGRTILTWYGEAQHKKLKRKGNGRSTALPQRNK